MHLQVMSSFTLMESSNAFGRGFNGNAFTGRATSEEAVDLSGSVLS